MLSGSGLTVLQLPGASTQSQWAIICAMVILAGTLIAALSKVVTGVKTIVAPIREFMYEHDVLWEDYNIRTGGSYRRTTGRGTPPEPEEWYRTHPIKHDDEAE